MSGNLTTQLTLSSAFFSPQVTQKLIGVRFTLDNVTDINTASQSFRATFRMVFRWAADPNDEKTYDEDNVAWESKWKPKLTFKNAVDQPSISVKPGKDRFYFLHDVDGKKWVEYTFRCEATFMEPFELKAFPFDCQDLSIRLELGNKGASDKYLLVPDPTTTSFIKFDLQLCVLTEWELHPPMIEFGFSDPEGSKNGAVRPQFLVKLKLQRNYKFYLNRVCLFLALLSLLTLCSYASGVADVADRLSLDFTLLLSLAAYQSVVGSYLPMLSFLTYIDLYMTAVVSFVCVISIEHAILGYLVNTLDGEDDYSTIKYIDDGFFYAFGIMWFIFHFGFAIYLPILIKNEQAKMRMGSQELKSRRNKGEIIDSSLDTYFITNKMIGSASSSSDLTDANVASKFLESLQSKQWVTSFSKTKASADPSEFIGED